MRSGRHVGRGVHLALVVADRGEHNAVQLVVASWFAVGQTKYEFLIKHRDSLPCQMTEGLGY